MQPHVLAFTCACLDKHDQTVSDLFTASSSIYWIYLLSMYCMYLSYLFFQTVIISRYIQEEPDVSSHNTLIFIICIHCSTYLYLIWT